MMLLKIPKGLNKVKLSKQTSIQMLYSDVSNGFLTLTIKMSFVLASSTLHTHTLACGRLKGHDITLQKTLNKNS